MTLEEFAQKHDELFGDMTQTKDVLMRIASNLSDLQYESTFSTTKDVVEKCDSLKEYIFDYISVLRSRRML